MDLTSNSAHATGDEACIEEMLVQKPEPDTLDRPLTSLLSGLLASIETIEEQYAINITKALEDLTHNLSSSFSADDMEWLTSVRKEFEERVLAAYMHWNSQRQKASNEIKTLDIRWTGKSILHEIAQIELAIQNREDHIDWMLRNTSVELSTIMRIRILQSEMKAYLRGLTFQAGVLYAQPLRTWIPQ